MADQLPTYDKSVKLEVTAQPDTDSSAQMLINSFKAFSNAITNDVSTVNKQEAEQQRAILKNNISNSYRQFSESSLLNPDQTKGLVDYNEKAKSYSQQLMAQTSPFNRDYVKNLVDYYDGVHRSPLIKNSINQNKRIQSADFVSRDVTAGQDVISAVQNSNATDGELQFHAADSLHAQRIQAMKQAVVQGSLTAKQYATGLQEANNQLTIEKIIKKYKDSVDQGNSTQFIKELINTNIPGFDEKKKAGIFALINNINNQHLAEYGLSRDQLNQQKKANLKAIEENGALPNSIIRDMNAQVNPEDAENYDKQIAISQQVYKNRQAAVGESPYQVQEMKDKLKPTDPNAPNFVDLKQLYDKSVAAIDLDRKKYFADPMEVVRQQPFISDAVKNYDLAKNVGALGVDDKNTPYSNRLDLQWDMVKRYQEGLGSSPYGDKSRRVKFLRAPYAQDVLRQINLSTPSQKIDIFNKLRRDFGGGSNYNLVMQQLHDEGLNPKLAFLGGFDPLDADSQNIQDAMTIPTAELGKVLKSKDEAAFKNINTTIYNDLYNNGGGTANFRNFLASSASYAGGRNEDYYTSVQEVVQSLAYHYYNTGVENDYKSAVNRAENTIGNKYNYTVIHNQTLNVPRQYDPETIKNYALSQESKLKDFPFVVTKMSQEGQLRPEIASSLDKEIIMNGHWVGGSTDQGAVWVDFNGRLATDKNGHPFYFDYSDAQQGYKTVHPSEISEAYPSVLKLLVDGKAGRLIDLFRDKK